MSGPTLDTKLSPDAEGFRTNAAHNRALVEELQAKVATAAAGGPVKAREKRVGRGKLLPRERVERLLDAGSPFLEIGQLTANGMYHGEVPGAGIIAGIGRVEGTSIFYAVGHQHIGLTLAPVTGELMSDLAAGRQPRHDISAFDLRRF